VLFKPADKAVAAFEARLRSSQGSLKGTLDDVDGPLYASVDPISNKITELVDLQLRVAGIEHDAAEGRFFWVRSMTIGIVSLALAMGAFLGWMVVSGVSRTLHSVATHLREGAEQIVAASSQVSSSAQILSQDSSDQAASLEETSAAMEEMAAMTRRNADNSRTAAGLMTEVDTRVQASNRSLDDMVASMGAIQESRARRCRRSSRRSTRSRSRPTSSR